jgi:hypothetical protein
MAMSHGRNRSLRIEPLEMGEGPHERVLRYCAHRVAADGPLLDVVDGGKWY